MAKASQFGTRLPSARPAQSQSAEEATVHVCSRIDFIRGVLAALIREYHSLPAQEKDSCFIKICTVQDQILSFRHRHPSAGARTSALSWVDGWKPE
jgi:hypothetical protein